MSVDERGALRGRGVELEAVLERASNERPPAFPDFFKAIIDSLPDGAFVVDAHGNVETTNARAAEIFGVPIASFTSIAPFLPAFVRGSHAALVSNFVERAAFSRTMASGRTVAFERPNGEQRHVEIALAPIVLAGHRRVFVRVTDVTERVAKDEVTRHLAAIVEHSADAIIGVDLEGRITSWNTAARALYGRAAAEVIGRSLELITLPQLAADVRLGLERLKGDGAPPAFESRIAREDGAEVDVSITLSPVRDADGRLVGAALILRDVTETKKRDLELRRSNAELEQFAYVASHDLQEPLRMVANYTELLGERYRGKLDEKADRYIHFASDGARRMQQLVNDLLAFSRVGSEGKPLVPVDTSAVVERLLRVLEPRLREVGGEVSCSPLPTVLADDGQLGQLFQNLLTNALKFRSERPPKVTVSAERDGACWRFSVSDNGIGLDMRFAERIFQMFQRLHDRSRYPGSGIGLAIAKRVVERHGGQLWVESTMGVGTTFLFTLLAPKEG